MFYLKFPPPLQEAQKPRPGLRGPEFSAATGQAEIIVINQPEQTEETLPPQGNAHLQF